MHKNVPKKTTLVSIASVIASLLTVAAPNVANAHGYVISPESRAYKCKQYKDKKVGNPDCPNAASEPQSIEGPKGFPEGGPPDEHIASGGLDRFKALDDQSPNRWKKVNISPGDKTFQWHYTAGHVTASWRFFITKQGWDQSKPLTRSDFQSDANGQPTPFCSIEGNDFQPTDNKTYSYDCKGAQGIPSGLTGYHVILAVWDIGNTKNAFYQVIDVDFGKDLKNTTPLSRSHRVIPLGNKKSMALQGYLWVNQG